MANEVLTRVSVDASGFEAGMERTKRAADGFVANQQASAHKFDACQQQMAASSTLAARALEEAVNSGKRATARQVIAAVKGFEKVADTAGKTRFDLMRLRAANLGIAESAEPLIAKAEAASKAMHHLGAGSVAARRELFVLGHEAMQGSWKNFMGSLMVLAERIDVLPMLCGPAGVALGALGASAYAAYHAIHSLTEQQEELDRAMLLTSNYAALTQGKLLAYSDAISRNVGVSVNEARDALMALARSGHVAGADMRQSAEGIAAFAKASGQSVEDTTRQFLQSYGHATDAARKWREDHHDLSQEQIDHIRILELSGDKAGAWAAFVQAASESARKAVASDNREMAQSYETLGQKWERFWRTVTGKADELTKLQDAIASRRSMLYDADANPFGLNTAAIEKDIADLEHQRQAVRDRVEKGGSHQRRVDAFSSMMEHHAEYMKPARTWKEKLADANRETNEYFDAVKRAGEAAGKTREEIKALEADRQKMLAHNAELYRPHDRKTRERRADAGARYLEQVREQGAALEAQMHMSEKLTNAQKELARFNERMAAAKQHVASAEEKSLLHSEKQIRVALEHNVALEKANTLRAAQVKLAQRADQAHANLVEYQQGQKERYARVLDERAGGAQVAPLGRQEQADMAEIVRHYQHALDALRQTTPAELLGSGEYRKEVEQIKLDLDRSSAMHAEHFATLRRLRDDWTAGLGNGVADFYKDTLDKAEMARQAMVKVMSRMEDAVAKFVTTGKLGVREFVASALADLSKLALHQAMGGIIASLIGRSPTTGVIAQLLKLLPHHAQGGSISGPGTGTSDSIPAMLSDGEYVVNAASARQHHALLEAINSNHLAHFSSGGLAAASSPASRRPEPAQVRLEVHNHGPGALSEHDLRELQAMVSAFVDKRIARKMGGQGGIGYLLSQGHLA